MKKIALVLTTAILVFPGAALALDLTQPLKTFEGQDFVGSDGKPIGLTYESVITNALFTDPVSQDPAKAGDEKSRNYLLAYKVHQNAKDYAFTPDEVIQVRKALAATQVTAVFGTVMATIDATYLPKKP